MRKMTLPQLYMYNFSSWYNRERSEWSSEQKRKKEQKVAQKKRTQDEKDPIINGKRLSEMNTDEYVTYWYQGMENF